MIIIPIWLVWRENIMEKYNKTLSKVKQKVHQKIQPNVQNNHDYLVDIEIVKVKVEIEIKFRENL